MRKDDTESWEGDYVLLGVPDEKAKDKLGGYTEIPYWVLDRTTQTFVLDRANVF